MLMTVNCNHNLSITNSQSHLSGDLSIKDQSKTITKHIHTYSDTETNTLLIEQNSEITRQHVCLESFYERC